MRVLVACEFSGIVRDAFIAQGHDATSCDLLGCETAGPHYRMPVQFVPLIEKYELVIAHPPCTFLAVSGARWFATRQRQQEEAIEFVRFIAELPVERIAIENPIGVLSSKWRKPDQIIQPWMFGHGETKATCLWLKNLPLLVPTNIVEGRTARVHREPPSPDRWKNRSRTLKGIAEAMASQWGALDLPPATSGAANSCETSGARKESSTNINEGGVREMAETKLLSPSRVEEIAERVEKATAGPWEARLSPGAFPHSVQIRGGAVEGGRLGYIAQLVRPYGPPPGNVRGQEETDADFIAASRTDIPDLLAERKLLVGIVREQYEALQGLADKVDAVVKQVDPFIVLASVRAGKDLYDGPRIDPELTNARQLLSDPDLVSLLKEQG